MQVIQKQRTRGRQILTSILVALLITSFPGTISAASLTPVASVEAAAVPATGKASNAGQTTESKPATEEKSKDATQPADSKATAPANTDTDAKAETKAETKTDAKAATPAADTATETAAPTTAATANTPASSIVNTTQAAPTAGTISTATTSSATPAITQATTVQNNTLSTAKSGNAALLNNDDVGDAKSGKAAADATIINVVGTGTGGLGTPVTFVQDIYNTPGLDEIQGNITLDPNTLLPADGTTNSVAWHNPTQNSTSLVDLENNVVLNATSGNADILNNDDTGSATTGDATALANIINIVSSSVGARNTFLGVINIHGNLKGDILVPSSLVDSLFGSNASSLSADQTTNGTLTTTSNVNITNNVDLAATSGSATLRDNDSAGDAKTGNATTSLTVFNLTGQEVIAKNSLLVFVNVLGKWVGVIINAPAGSTAAALSGGATTAAQQRLSGNYANTVNITNNVSATATSGNATVAGNDDVGNATSGNAAAGANILNLVHSSFNLDDWFGVLFINVIGSWLGNFGIAPPPAQPGTTTTPDVPNPGSALSDRTVRAVKVFRFNESPSFTPAASTGQTDDYTPPPPELSTVSVTKPAGSGEVLSYSDDPGMPALPQSLASRDLTPLFAMLAGLLLLSPLAVIILRHRRLANR